MKKIISLILVALMSLSIFASCSKGNKPSGSSQTPASSSSTEEESSSSSKSSSSSTSSSKSSSTSSGKTDSSSKSDESSDTSSKSDESSNTSSKSDESSDSSDTGGIVDPDEPIQETIAASKRTDSGFSYEDYETMTSKYNRNLFYYNECKFEVADPSVIYVSKAQSAEYGGYFYAYGTSDQLGCHGLQAWRSKDLTNWEDLGPVYRPDLMNNWGRTNFWAPECIYDPEGETINGVTYHYFMFYNADMYSTVVNNGESGGLLTSSTTPTFEQNCRRYMSVIYATSPVGPFVSPEGVANKDGKILDHTKPAYDFKDSAGINDGYRCPNTIDASPFIDSDGQKYLYYSGYGASYNGRQCIYGVKMKDWLTPDYSTVTMICEYGKYTVGGSAIGEGDGVNEAPFMTKSGNTYMMTFSTFGYMNVNYQVRLATSNNPLSGFRKVDPKNGGTIIRTERTWTGVQSAGHHCFISVGEQLFIAYHTFKDRTSISGGRALAVDECKLIDYNGGKIIATNGPSLSYQPLPYDISGYKNIASEATIKVNYTNSSYEQVNDTRSDLKYLTDGLVKYHNESTYGNYTSDYKAGGDTYVTLTFSSYKSVRALMVYLPYEYGYRFKGLTDVKLYYNGGTVTIPSVSLDEDHHFNVGKGAVKVPGGALILEFADLPVNKIEFKLDNALSDGYPIFEVGMGEIVVLSNPNGSTGSVTNVNKEYSYLNAEVPVAVKHDQGKTLGSVNVNGTVYHTTYGFDNLIAEDDGTVGATVTNRWTNDQYAFFKGVNSDTVYFEGKINVYESSSYLNDKWPKLGLVLKNYQACTFFYIDAANNYTQKQLGYTQSKIGGGDWDWNGTEVLSTKYTAGKIVYKGGENYVKLAIAREGDTVRMYCEDIQIFEVTGLRGLGAGSQAAAGFLCFNSGMKIKDYKVITGTNAVSAKVAELKAITDDYVANQSGGTSGMFGDVDSLHKSATTWDTSKDYASGHELYANRKLTLTGTDNNENLLFYKEVSNTLVYMEGTFNATGITSSSESHGKFGYKIVDFFGEKEAGEKGAVKNGIFFYVDAKGSGTITGRDVGLAVYNNGIVTYDVKTKAGVYSYGTPIKLGVFRQAGRFIFFVNDTEVFRYEESALLTKANPSFCSFNIGLEVTEYRISTSKTDPIIAQYYENEVDNYGMINVTFGDVDASRNGWNSVGFTEKRTGGATNTTDGETVTFANVAGQKLYFEAEISCTGTIYNNDGAPKVGLLIKTATCDFLFAIDALPNGKGDAPYFGGNNWVCFGFRTTNDGANPSGWTWCDAEGANYAMFREVVGMTYNSSGSAKMQVLYLDGTLYLAVNNAVIYKIEAGSISGLSGGINVGIMAFNLNVVVAGGKACTDDTAIETVKANLGIVDTTAGITIDGDLSDWTTGNAKYSYWDTSTTPLGFEVMAKMGETGVLVGLHGVIQNINTLNRDWWLNTNIEMKAYSSTNVRRQVYINLKNQAMLVGSYAFNYKKNSTNNVYDVYFEFVVPYSQIGYTGSEEAVWLYFALRPGTPASGVSDKNSKGEEWWSGTVHQDQQGYNGVWLKNVNGTIIPTAVGNTYKVTKDGITFVNITNV